MAPLVLDLSGESCTDLLPRRAPSSGSVQALDWISIRGGAGAPLLTGA
jgi:hypothetical protein